MILHPSKCNGHGCGAVVLWYRSSLPEGGSEIRVVGAFLPPKESPGLAYLCHVYYT